MLSVIVPPKSFDAQYLRLAWQWVNEYPSHNFSDEGPQDEQSFIVEMQARQSRGETLLIVCWNQEPVGFIGYVPLSERLGQFHGICFARKVHGTGIACHAVQQFIAALHESGVDKICAYYYTDNQQIEKFLGKLGFVREGLLRRHVVRDGKPVDLAVVALFK